MAAETWTGRWPFVLAAVGSAVGLGSIWKFPYEVGANGGAAFVLFYVAGLALIVVPLVLVEFAIGRRGGADAAASVAAVAAEHGRSRAWGAVGALGALTSLLILSFYAVIGGWTLAYTIDTPLLGLPADPTATRERFDGLLASPMKLMAYQAVFLAVTCAVVARGVRRGIETASNILMPALILIMIVLCAYAIVEGDVSAAARFLFSLDLERISAGAALEAVGLGFFSIGVGLGVLITYAAYAGAEINLMKAALMTVVADTAISFLAGFTVFPIVFAGGMDPASGPGLVFVTLPLGFAAMPAGGLAAVAFFLLLFVTALASAISLLEIVTAIAVRRLSWSRLKASVTLTLATFALGLASVFSFNLWASWYPLRGLPGFGTATAFDILDYATSNILLPITGLALCIFAGWALPAGALADELRLGPRAARVLGWIVRYAVPAAIIGAALAPAIQR